MKEAVREKGTGKSRGRRNRRKKSTKNGEAKEEGQKPSEKSQGRKKRNNNGGRKKRDTSPSDLYIKKSDLEKQQKEKAEKAAADKKKCKFSIFDFLAKSPSKKRGGRRRGKSGHNEVVYEKVVKKDDQVEKKGD